MERHDYILGIATLGHELSLTVVDTDGDVVVIAEEERYSRKKGGQFVLHPDLAVKVLGEFGVDLDAVRVLAIAGDPSSWDLNDQQIPSFSPEARARHLDAWISKFRGAFPRIERTKYLRHHRAHAASGFFPSPWDEAAVVTLDGYGDGEVATISYGSGPSLKVIERQPFPHSVAYLYQTFAAWLGLEGHERAGKLMALAAYGHPSEQLRLRQILSTHDTGPWRLVQDFLGVECQSKSWTNVLEHLLGPRRRPEDPIDQSHCNAAASIQALLEAELLALFRRAKALTGASRVCCAGGAFLNCRANGVLQESGIFESYFFQPLAADCGLSLGAALQTARESGRERWRMRDIRLGSSLDLDNLPSIAREADLRLSPVTDVIGAAARQLAEGSVVGWCQGRSEVGPRSLCGRSLLANPLLEQMKNRLNRIKRRESWRPFAPVMLEEETSFMFGKAISAPHMNVAFRVTCPERIPAAVHIDGTARLQTVTEAEDPLTTQLLRRFKELTGFGVLVNTSLNLRGHPIARTVRDCVAFYCESEIDALFIGDFMVERTDATHPIKLRSIPEWKGLPQEFVLAALNPDGGLEQWIEDLKAGASGLVELTVNSSFEIGLTDDILQRIADENVVFLLPGYFEVCRQTLPRALAWALQIESRCLGLWLADLSGKIVRSDLALHGLEVATLLTQPLSDVEIHYLRNAARKREN